MNILELLKPSDKTALIQGRKRVSFDELLDLGGKFGTALSEAGIKKDCFVLMYVPLSIELYISMIGCWSIGAVPVFIDFSQGASFIGKSVARIKPSAVVCDSITGIIRALHPKMRGIRPINVNKRGNDTAIINDTAEITQLPDDHPAIVTFTSGSTGHPKASLRTHGFLIKQYNVLKEHLDFDENHVDLGTLPVFTLANLASGMTTLLPERSLRSHINFKKLSNQAERESVTRIICSPALFHGLLTHSRLPSLRLAYLGGAPVYPSLLEKAPKHIQMNIVYGSTEAEPIASICTTDMTDLDKNSITAGKGLLVGHVIPALECIISEDGEILVTGETVLKGYLDGVGDSENKVRRNGKIWHRTGDAGYFDEQGRLWLLGRVNQIITDNQGKLYPFCVECVLDSRFGIRGAVLALGGKRVAVIEQGNVDADDVLNALKPFNIAKVTTIPKLPMDKRHRAKIDYQRLVTIFGHSYLSE